MKLALEETSKIAVITALPNVLDAENAAEFKDEVTRILQGKTQVIFDMSTVHFMDSAGCGALITALRHVKDDGGVLKLYGVTSQVRRVIELVRMYKIIDIFETKKQAMRSFQS
ncbi:MAG TPA: STAS domain-containing protein [Deltaproteobacteria bacterium]|nr:STAS domain-containing protein [Deltaproteobacteria bacterium]HPJ92848.1 STAS domain-containing protein [Deltaproteobacteria bacterium]HPR51015.1 STAS domain-containing protein [Deltaproteobacteria bacterium]